MPNMSRYCKAIPSERLAGYGKFAETIAADPSVTDTERGFYYLHDNFFVTKDTFVDTEIVFDEVTPDWQTYCRDVLEFDPEGALGSGAPLETGHGTRESSGTAPASAGSETQG